MLFIFPVLYGASATDNDSEAAQRQVLLGLMAQKKEQINQLYLEEEQLRLNFKKISEAMNLKQPDPIEENAKKDELGRAYEEAVKLYGEDAVNQEDYYVKNEYPPAVLEHQAQLSTINELILQYEEELFTLQKQHDELLPIYS